MESNQNQLRTSEVNIVTKWNEIWFLKWTNYERLKKKNNSKMTYYCALFCALSVGAAIVIARPDDASQQRTGNEIYKSNSIPADDKVTQFDIINENNCTTLWQKTKDRAKDIALKSIDIGKKITYKATNVTVYVADKIGNTLASILD